MLRPSPPELLRGGADALEADVLAVLPAGPARDQTQAAIAIVRRVARTLPGYTAYLLADIADLRATLGELGVEPDGTEPGGHDGHDGHTPLDARVEEDLRLRAVLAERIDSGVPDDLDALVRAALIRLNEREAGLRQSPWER